MQILSAACVKVQTQRFQQHLCRLYVMMRLMPILQVQSQRVVFKINNAGWGLTCANDSKHEIQPIEGYITWGSKSSDNRTFDDFTSRWITDWPSLLWRYSKASATPIATLYLSVQLNTSGFFLLPIFQWNEKKKLVRSQGHMGWKEINSDKIK